ncbi:GAF domain-containing protein [Nostoc sp.]|uniref:GAF domain-containing protein n=1 Tax=Nostoc sp. TaxID=1180 RepID=UPI002FF77654
MHNSQHLPEDFKAFEQQILQAENQIAKATTELFHLELILDRICHEIQDSLGFDFVNISLVMPASNTIEAVHGIGIGKNWVNRARHYLEDDPELRDIQADIVKECHTEIISGQNERFDSWIFETFDHHNLVRIFTPIILIRDESGKTLENWFEKYDWEENFVPNQVGIEKQHTIISMKSAPGYAPPKVIGSVEAGYENCDTKITHQQAIALAKLVARRALDIRKARLRYVLETVAENARHILKADFTTLHFLWEPQKNHYIYEVCAGCIDHLLLKDFPPRNPSLNGLGWQAIIEGKPKFLPDLPKANENSQPSSFNPIALKEGSRTYAAFPLLLNGSNASIQEITALDRDGGNHHQHKTSQGQLEPICVGVLYVHFQREHQFSQGELQWGELFASHAVDAIWHAITYQQMHDKARQLATIHSVAQSLSRIPENADLLGHIAWNTLNVLAADVVTIYAYIQTEDHFLPEVSYAGRLKEEQKMKDTKLDKQDVPFLLIGHGENIYASIVSNEPIFQDSAFSQREKIQSVAGVLLRVERDIVGVMFINYRRTHDFSGEEKQIINTLASSAATAIKNQRWLQTLSSIDRKIITTLEENELLKLIVQQSVQITGAELGTIRLLDPVNKLLVTKVSYPESIPTSQAQKYGTLDKGITGWVATHRQPALVNDVQSDVRYQPCFNNVRSELCVPLLDKDRGVIGVLNVEGRKPKEFDQGDLRRLEVLADLAVIAIQNAETKEQLVKTEAIATLGELAGPLVHKINNYVGAIRVWAQDIFDENDDCACSKALEIISLANKVLEDAECLKIWLQEQRQPINLKQVVIKAVNRMHISSNIKQNLNISASLPEVFAGKQQLIYVFDNLIQNAVDAILMKSEIKGELSIEARTDEEGFVKIIVNDSGVGIAQENLEKIFQPDYSTKDARRGMGFGLWWTRFYVERLGGKILVDSSFYTGTKFSVILPIYKSGM